jgi:uncharacterized protein
MLLNIILLFVGTIAAFWISAICGGGASLILIPILNLLLPASVVPFSLTIGTFTSSASRIAVFRKHIRWQVFLWFVPFSIPAVLLGAWLIKFVNPNYLQVIVAFFLILNLPEFFKSKKAVQENLKNYPKLILVVIGFCAGFVSGITGAIGLLFNRFYLRFGLSKEEIVATRAANEIFLHFIKLIIYLIIGLYSKTALWLGLTIAVATVISSYTVKYILPYLSEFLFRKIGYGAMVVSGVVLMAGTTQKIIVQDKISFANIKRNHETESILSWRNTDLVIEFAFDNGFEVERPVKSNELPPHLKEKYDQLIKQYDHIGLEKVFTVIHEPEYELYCYKHGILYKFTWSSKNENFK